MFLYLFNSNWRTCECPRQRTGYSGAERINGLLIEMLKGLMEGKGTGYGGTESNDGVGLVRLGEEGK